MQSIISRHNLGPGYIFQTYGTNVCPRSSDPTLDIESNYFIQSNSCDLKLFCSVNEEYST